MFLKVLLSWIDYWILQYNKIDNLKIVVERINGTLIKPGETFSFCKTVGLPTKKKGYKTREGRNFITWNYF